MEALSGQVAAITGAPSGIGLACAVAELDGGARVVLVDHAEEALHDLSATLAPDAHPLVVR